MSKVIIVFHFLGAFCGSKKAINVLILRLICPFFSLSFSFLSPFFLFGFRLPSEDIFSRLMSSPVRCHLSSGVISRLVSSLARLSPSSGLVFCPVLSVVASPLLELFMNQTESRRTCLVQSIIVVPNKGRIDLRASQARKVAHVNPVWS